MKRLFKTLTLVAVIGLAAGSAESQAQFRFGKSSGSSSGIKSAIGRSGSSFRSGISKSKSVISPSRGRTGSLIGRVGGNTKGGFKGIKSPGTSIGKVTPKLSVPSFRPGTKPNVTLPKAGIKRPGVKPQPNPGIRLPGINPLPRRGGKLPGVKPLPKPGIKLPGVKPLPGPGIKLPGVNPLPGPGIKLPGVNPPPKPGVKLPGIKPLPGLGIKLPGVNPPPKPGIKLPGFKPLPAPINPIPNPGGNVSNAKWNHVIGCIAGRRLNLLHHYHWCHYRPAVCHWWVSYCRSISLCHYYHLHTCDWVRVRCAPVVTVGVAQEADWYLGIKGMLLPGKGLGIDGVEPGSPAELVGLQPGMVMTSCNGIDLVDEDSLAQAIRISGGVLNMTLLSADGTQVLQGTVQMTLIPSVSL